MGCCSSHSILAFGPQVTPIRIHVPVEKPGSFKARISEAIKKRDPILFEMTIKAFNAKIDELITSYDKKRTLFHHIAEFNFAEGMIMLIDHVYQKEINKLRQITTSLDIYGNTAAMTCCKYKALETLTVLVKWELVDINIKNNSGKTVLEVAMENWSDCISLLTSATISNLKLTNKYNTGVTDLSETKLKASSPTVKLIRKSSRKLTLERDLNITNLTSLTSIAKQSASRFSYHSKIFSLLTDLKEKDSAFIDPEFPHDILSTTSEDSGETLALKPNNLKWIPASKTIEL